MFEAFVYMFKSKNAIIKILILALMYLPGTYLLNYCISSKPELQQADFILFLIISVATFLIASGYCAKITNNLYKKCTSINALPSWDWKFVDYLILGLRKWHFLTIAQFALMIQSYNPKNMFTPEAGVDLAIEAVFCSDLSDDLSPDLAYVYDDIRANLGLFYKLTTINFVMGLPVCFLLVYLYYINYNLNYIVGITCVAVTYYTLVYAYSASIVANRFASQSIGNLE